jgi:hypothetical protein
VRDRGWLTARINTVDAVIIAEGNRAACKATSRPVPAPIRPGRCEVYKRLNVAGCEICDVQLHTFVEPNFLLPENPEVNDYRPVLNADATMVIFERNLTATPNDEEGFVLCSREALAC